MEKELNRSQIAALDAYPVHKGASKEWIKLHLSDGDCACFIKGYEQAEKDLTLTWEDMAKIDAIIIDVNNAIAVDYSKKISRQNFYKEVLKRFNELKK